MKSYILISTKNHDNSDFTSTVEWNEDEIGIKPKFIADNEEQSVNTLKQWIYPFLDMMSKKWLIFNQQEYRDGTNCPNGLLEVKSDVWLCKIDKEICDLQAVIDLDNLKDFRKKCRATENVKDNFTRIVTNEDYKGFHHTTGRYQCPKCQIEKKQEKFSYHYPWEFVPVIDLPISTESLMEIKKITDRILSRFFAEDPIICSKCTSDLLNELQIDSANFKILEYEIDRKKLNL